MKATLQFNLDDPTDRELHQSALKSTSYERVFEEWENFMRSKVKYGTEEESILWEPIREEYFRIKNEIIGY